MPDVLTPPDRRLLFLRIAASVSPHKHTQAIYAECAEVLYDEIDYINEGRNADRCVWVWVLCPGGREGGRGQHVLRLRGHCQHLAG
jgi:hypothetical protein